MQTDNSGMSPAICMIAAYIFFPKSHFGWAQTGRTY